MKIEFLESGSADCPLIRIFGEEPDTCLRLKQIFEQLAEGAIQQYSLCDSLGIEPVNCRLIAKTGKRDRGVLRDEGDVFEWILTASTWDNVVGLIEPFCKPRDGGHGFQWLEQAGDIRVVVSSDGDW